MEKPWNIEISDVQMPKPKEGEALLRVKSAGICGSDIGAFRGTNGLVSYPRIIGHEIAGEVISIPENNKNGIKPGDRVIVDPYLYCGHCYPCSIGRTNCCVDLKVLGVHVDGGMAEYFCHPADMLLKVPDDMPWDIIPLAEPLTIALHGIHRLNLKAGEHIAINGAGPIGLLAAMVALMIMCRAQLTEISAQVVSVQKEISALEDEHVALLTRYEKTFDLTTIKEAAAAAGMAKPSASQVYYIDLSEPDSVVVYQQKSQNVLSRALTSLGNGVCAVVEYFK